MARPRSRKTTFTVDVEGLGEALLVPDQLEVARITFPRRLATELAIDMRRRLPRGPGPRHVADEVTGEVITAANVVTVGTEGSAYAKALEEGAHRPNAAGLRAKTVLKFVIDGRVVFARRSIIRRDRPGGKPFTKALRARRGVVDRVWTEVMRA